LNIVVFLYNLFYYFRVQKLIDN